MLKKLSIGDRIFYAIDYMFIALVICITLYPFVYILSCSISNPAAVAVGKVWLLPKGITFDAYRRVIEDRLVWISYKNTLWYVSVGTTINMLLTTITAYPLSRKRFSGRNPIMMFISFTMFFSGGMVPTYLLVKNLGLINSRWAIVIPVAISTWNLIIMRTFFEGIPESLYEAATIDGCNDIGILLKIYLSLSKPVMAVMVLFYAVSHWNSYFNAMLYLNKEELYPLQMLLRKILIQYEQSDLMADVMEGRDAVGQTIRYATIIISSLPIISVYPFLQKYFVKGVMIGAIKG
ncbi:MAG: carbohydrate ABC transporter permease [Firmicutes bacterium]|nr:carbohydrate ABC transporter permease [Bacillota bacterium]